MDFSADTQRRQALMDRVYAVRAALMSALDQRDGAAALKALSEAYAIVDIVPDAQLLYVPGGESLAFVLPEGGRRMEARYGGRCSVCSDRFQAGSIIHYYSVDKSAVCARCLGGDALKVEP